MGFGNITYKDIRPSEYEKDGKEKVRKLNDNLNERSKAIQSLSTTDAEAIELMEIISEDIDTIITSEDIDTTVKGVERETPFIKVGEKDKLLPLRKLEGIDNQHRTIRGSLKVAIAKRIDLKGRIEDEERKLSEIQDPTYSDDQITMIQDRMKTLRDEPNEKNEEIDILKGEASKQINQITGSFTEFLDKKKKQES